MGSNRIACERRNLLASGHVQDPPYVRRCLEGTEGPVIAATDYLRSLPDGIARWVPRKLHSLGTDGYSRSDTRAALRDFFEVDARYVAFAALRALADEGDAEVAGDVARARDELGIREDKQDPLGS